MNRGWIRSVPSLGFVRWSRIYTAWRLIPQARQERFDEGRRLGRSLDGDFVTAVGASQSRPFDPGDHLLAQELGGEHRVLISRDDQSGRKRGSERSREIVTAAHSERLSFGQFRSARDVVEIVFKD